MTGYIVILVLFIVYGLTLAGGLITYFIKSVKTPAIRAELEQEYQEKHKRLESEYAEKEAALKKREQKVAFHEERDKSFSSRWQQLIDRERKVEERERLAEGLADRLVAERERELDRREQELEQRKQSLLKKNEEIIARRIDEKVADAIGYKEDDLAAREWIVTRRCYNLIKRQKKFVACEQEMYKRAVLISNHLGIPLKHILKPTEKKLVDKIANELTDERQVLMDLVMSCPEDQLKDLLASMQRLRQSWPGSPPPPPASEN